jgi:hypothetical protein
MFIPDPLGNLGKIITKGMGKLKALSKPLREKIGGIFGKSNKPDPNGKPKFDKDKHSLNKAQLQKLNDDLADNKALKDAMDGVNGNPDLVDAWKKVDDLGEDAFDQLRKDPDFLKKLDKVSKDVNVNDHVFKGHIKKKFRDDGSEYWEAGGVHSKKAIDDGHASLRTTPEPIGPDGAGYYRAKLKVFDPDNFPQNGGWKSKTKASTFFPDDWGVDKIQAEISRVLNNSPTVIQSFPDGRKLLGGTMTDGVSLRIWQVADGSLESAFPKFN